MFEASELSPTSLGSFSGNLVESQCSCQQVRVIILNKGQHLESTLFCLEKGTYQLYKNCMNLLILF